MYSKFLYSIIQQDHFFGGDFFKTAEVDKHIIPENVQTVLLLMLLESRSTLLQSKHV